MISKLNIIEFSDVHLGHRSTPAYHIIDSIDEMLFKGVELETVDMIIIAGDLFDRLLYLSNKDLPDIHKWIYHLLNTCKKHDIVLRVLEGTPSHDASQPGIMVDINNESGINCDFKYFDDMQIEYIERFDINVLYIPDEYHADNTQTLREFRELLVTHNLEKVDFAVMHGAFDYQIPKHLLTRVPHHDSAAYLSLVKYLIFIGHIHQYSQLERIISAGSTDRLQHGEEESKGIIKVTVYDSGQFDATFIKNKNAMVYKTIDLTGVDDTKALGKLEAVVNKHPHGSYFRVKAGADNSVVNAIKMIRAHHPEFVWTTITQKEDDCQTELLKKPTTGMANLHAKTIPTLMRERLNGQVDDIVADQAVELLKDIINGNSSNSTAVT